MTPTQIGLLVIAVVAVIIVGSLIMQGIENQRRERRLRILTLKDQIRRVDHLLNALPLELTSNAVYTLLVQYLIGHWRELGQLDATAPSQQQIQRLTEQAKSTQLKPVAASGLTLFANKQQAANARAVMREIAQFISDLQTVNRYPVQQLQPILNQVKIGYSRAKLDLELYQSMEAEQNRGPLVAVHQYRSCEKMINKLSRFAPMDTQKQAIDSRIMNCEVALEQERERKEAVMAAEAEHQKNPLPFKKRDPQA